MLYNVVDIQNILPHRYPFLFVDKIIEFIPGKLIVGIKNVKFDIAEGLYTTYKIYGDLYLIEHGDEAGGTIGKLESQFGKRQRQLGCIITGIRVGHWHTGAVLERGRVIINGSVCGSDDYSEARGYDTQAMQLLNFYCKTKKRPTTFYKSFSIYLD
jgi:hypothetical protein